MENFIENRDNSLFCKNCLTEIGFFDEEIVIYRHKSFVNHRESFEYLLEEALCERINESNREVHIGQLVLKLLKWENFVYCKDKFIPCMNVLYQFQQQKGFRIPDEDLADVVKKLRKFNKKIPKNQRKLRDWRFSLIINQ